MRPNTSRKVLAVDHALSGVPHAFGGAVALDAYAEHRRSAGIDVNVFLPVDQRERVLEPLSWLGISRTQEPAEPASRVRSDFDGNTLDLFFSSDEFHDAAAAAVQMTTYAGREIPVLSASHLAVCKAVTDRPQDWVDIEAMREAGTRIDAVEVLRWVAALVGDTDPRYGRAVAALSD